MEPDYDGLDDDEIAEQGWQESAALDRDVDAMRERRAFDA